MKKVLAGLLAVLMVVTMLPVTAMADGLPEAKEANTTGEWKNNTYTISFSGGTDTEALAELAKITDGTTAKAYEVNTDKSGLTEATGVTVTFTPAVEDPKTAAKLELVFGQKPNLTTQTDYYIGITSGEPEATSYVKVMVTDTIPSIESIAITLDLTTKVEVGNKLPKATVDNKDIAIKTKWTNASGEELNIGDNDATAAAAGKYTATIIVESMSVSSKITTDTKFTINGKEATWSSGGGAVSLKDNTALELTVAEPEKEKIDISTATIRASEPDLITYDGGGLGRWITVLLNGEELDITKGYKLTFEKDGITVTDFIKAGTYKVIATGFGDYEGEVTREDVTVQKRTIYLTNATWNTAKEIVYDGKPHAPELSEDTLFGDKKFVDATYTYANDEGPVTSPTDAGTYTATATVKVKDGIDEASLDIKGVDENKQLTFSWTIAPAPVTSVVIAPKETVTEIGKGTVLQATVTPAGATGTYKWSGKGENTTGETYTIVEGDESITLTFTPTGNYVNTPVTSNAIKVGSVVIPASAVTVAEGPFTYSGQAQEPAVTVTVTSGDDEVTLTKGTDYDVTYSNNTNAGTATVTVVGKGSYAGTVTKNFTIGKATASVPTAAVTVEVGKVATITAVTDGEITATSSDSATLTADVSGATITLTGVKAGSATVTVSAAAGDNYTALTSTTINVTVKAASTSGGGSTGGGSTGGGSTVVTPPTPPTPSDTKPSATVQPSVAPDGSVTGKVDSSVINNLIGKADSNTSEVVVDVKAPAGADEVKAELPASSLKDLADKTNADLTVSTPVTDVTLTQDTLKELGNAEGTVTVTATQKDTGTTTAPSTNITVSVEQGGKEVAAGVTATVPSKVMDDMAAKDNSSVSVTTPVAEVTLPKDSLSQLKGSDVTVSTAKSGNATTVEVQKNGSTVNDVDMKVSLPVGDKDGDGTVAFIVVDGKETLMPKSIVDDGNISVMLNTGKATIVYKDNSKTFNDSSKIPGWAKADFASSRGLIVGTVDKDGTTSFSPNKATTRAQLVAMLHRLESEPSAGNASFDDVSGNSWFAEAAAWGKQVGIVAGTGSGFQGNRDISRQEMVMMLYQYMNKVTGIKGSSKDYSSLGGANQVGSWASDAMSWAYGSGIISGKATSSGTNLAPRDTATRAEVSAILERFVKLIAK